MSCTNCQLAAESRQSAERLTRLLSIVLAFDMIQGMVSPAVWILGASGSVVSKVSSLATYPDALAWAWLVMAALVLPFMATQICGRTCRRCIRLACFGLCGGGALWLFLAWLGRNLDYTALTVLFGFNCMVSVGMAAVLANSINESQKLEAGGLCEA
jgi:hypothetical protein